MTAFAEEPVIFDCAGESLVGVLSLPSVPSAYGVLVVVGGPQYRAGSHRQFTLLARHLAMNGIPTLRFDYRGMGDSTGPLRGFEAVDADITRAIAVFFERVPGMKKVVLWGLCDAASAALLYAHRDARIAGLVLLNPWVRTEQGFARTQLKHYYGARLFQASFWSKLIRGEVHIAPAVCSLLGKLLEAFRGTSTRRTTQSLPDRMKMGLQRFQGRVLLILSGRDLTAQEFKNTTGESPEWQALLRNGPTLRCDLAEADHTFSRRAWGDQVAARTLAWLRDMPSM